MDVVKWMAWAIKALQVSIFSCEKRRCSVPWNCRPTCVLSPRWRLNQGIYGKKQINDVIWSARATKRTNEDHRAFQMPCDLHLSSWWWNWSWLVNVRRGLVRQTVRLQGKVPGWLCRVGLEESRYGLTDPSSFYHVCQPPMVVLKT